ncbi:XVIPCD domain-containing protein [Stenotrophomonas sp. 169]|uniref:XVIPCD domain-containing protein n=1 Tax=Stenotrophomonas sp. 169 TaxID=2770322 RepID=UPI001CB77F84|nr:XVIPCD domain-containing protein [Stenotrophomonas sp. 169]
MGLARTNAGLFPTPNSDPDKIDRDGKTYSFHAESGTWSGQAPIESRIAIKLPVTDPALIEALNDRRALRQEREQLRTQFHPDDPNRSRPIQASPWLFTDASPVQEPSSATMQARITGAADPTEPEHPRHALYQQCIEGVHALDARLGRAPDQHSARMVASLTTLAVSSGLERVDHVLLSVRGTETAAGERVFVVQGDPGDPAHQRAHMPTEQATSTSTKQSFQQLAALDMHQEREQAQQLQREQDVPARAAPLMHS